MFLFFRSTCARFLAILYILYFYLSLLICLLLQVYVRIVLPVWGLIILLTGLLMERGICLKIFRVLAQTIVFCC
jgi:hypothetical protein